MSRTSVPSAKLKSFAFPFLLLLCLTSLSVLAQDEKTATPQTSAGTAEKAEQVIQRAIEAMGGASYLNVRSVTGRGQFTQFKDGQSGLPSGFVRSDSRGWRAVSAQRIKPTATAPVTAI